MTDMDDDAFYDSLAAEDERDALLREQEEDALDWALTEMEALR